MSTYKRVSGSYTIVTVNPSDTVTLTASNVNINGNLFVTGNSTQFNNLIKVTNISDASLFNTANAAPSGIQFTTGNTSATPAINIDWSGAVAVVRPNITIASAGTLTTIDSFYANTYSSAEYLLTSLISGTQIRELSKLLVTNNGTTAFQSEYGTLNTAGNTLVNWTASMSGNIVLLQANATNAGTIVRVGKTYLSN